MELQMVEKSLRAAHLMQQLYTANHLDIAGVGTFQTNKSVSSEMDGSGFASDTTHA